MPNFDLLAHSAGLCGQNMTYSFVAGWWFTFCIDILGIAPKKVGIITSVSRLWDAVNDPLIGSLVDKFRFKSGEKLRPYTLITPPIIGILSLLMFVNFRFAPGIILALMMVLYFFLGPYIFVSGCCPVGTYSGFVAALRRAHARCTVDFDRRGRGRRACRPFSESSRRQHS